MGQMLREDLSAQLLKSNEEYRRLVEEHSSYDRRLEELSMQRFPTPEEQVEELRLKKLKLQLKDKMQGMLKDHEQSAS